MSVFIIILALLTTTIEVEPNFDSFLKSDVNSSVMYDAFDAALTDRVAASRRLQDGGEILNLDIWTVYELHGTHNLTGGILNPSALRAVAKLEKSLRTRSSWEAMCARAQTDATSLCNPGVSFANYALASQSRQDSDVVPTMLTFDGQNSGALPPQLALGLVAEHNLLSTFFNSGFSHLSSAPYTTQLRSAFRFNIPYGSPGDSGTTLRSAKKCAHYRLEEFSSR
jgi:hypothetical protein